MFCSQGGNKYFPVREHLAQNKIGFSANKAGLLEIKLALLTDNDGVLAKSVHLSRRMVPSPLNKGILPFSSLLSSLPRLSQITPVISPSDTPKTSVDVSADCLLRRFDLNNWEKLGYLLGKYLQDRIFFRNFASSKNTLWKAQRYCLRKRQQGDWIIFLKNILWIRTQPKLLRHSLLHRRQRSSSSCSSTRTTASVGTFWTGR